MKEKSELKDIHYRAIELELLGKSITDIAKELEVSRKAVYEWKKTDAYSLLLNERRFELQSEQRQRLQNLVNKCIDTIEKHITDNTEDPRLAFQILKAMGLFDFPRIESQANVTNTIWDNMPGVGTNCSEILARVYE